MQIVVRVIYSVYWVQWLCKSVISIILKKKKGPISGTNSLPTSHLRLQQHFSCMQHSQLKIKSDAAYMPCDMRTAGWTVTALGVDVPAEGNRRKKLSAQSTSCSIWNIFYWMWRRAKQNPPTVRPTETKTPAREDMQLVGPFASCLSEN